MIYHKCKINVFFVLLCLSVALTPGLKSVGGIHREQCLGLKYPISESNVECANCVPEGKLCCKIHHRIQDSVFFATLRPRLLLLQNLVISECALHL